MAAPKHTRVEPTDSPRAYESPNHVPQRWVPDRPAEISGRQPQGAKLGHQGPDQGYILLLANRVKHTIKLQEGENLDDAIRGTIGIALKRASRFGRAPVIHDLTFALTIWGWFVDNPPAELLATRRTKFAGLRDAHHYYECRELVDIVPDTTFQLSIDKLTASTPMSWRALTGA